MQCEDPAVVRLRRWLAGGRPAGLTGAELLADYRRCHPFDRVSDQIFREITNDPRETARSPR
jgi:hypothetical protein